MIDVDTDTLYDFRQIQRIGDKQRLAGSIDGGGQPGIDHAFVINRNQPESQSLVPVAILQSGSHKMEIFST